MIHYNPHIKNYSMTFTCEHLPSLPPSPRPSSPRPPPPRSYPERLHKYSGRRQVVRRWREGGADGREAQAKLGNQLVHYKALYIWETKPTQRHYKCKIVFRIINTVEPVLGDHPFCPAKAVSQDRWSLIACRTKIIMFYR